MEFSSQSTGLGNLFLLQEIFPTQGLKPGLLYFRQILYQLSHQGSPRILEWVAIPSPGDPPDPRIEPGSPALQVGSLPTELAWYIILFIFCDLDFVFKDFCVYIHKGYWSCFFQVCVSGLGLPRWL